MGLGGRGVSIPSESPSCKNKFYIRYIQLKCIKVKSKFAPFLLKSLLCKMMTELRIIDFHYQSYKIKKVNIYFYVKHVKKLNK